MSHRGGGNAAAPPQFRDVSMQATRVSVAVLAVMVIAGPAFAADAPAGAASCSGCHASNPRAGTPVPPLAGRPAAEIATAMAEYKTGKRPGTIMDRIAKGFSDEENQAIAQWYSQQK
jgi:cytochrome subunit of sulfide dehydrogenase